MKTIPVLLIVLLGTLFTSCDNNDDPTTEETNPRKTIAANNSEDDYFQVELMADGPLYVGYNKLYLAVKETTSDEPVPMAAITFHPLMNMMDMSHAAPVEDPDEYPGDDGYFEGAVVFTMPDNADEKWTLAVAVEADGVKDTVNFDLSVASPEGARLVSVVSPLDGTSYFISLLEPSDPVVGINDIEFTVHEKENMMSFPPVGDVTLSIEPEMPSMGHGSPNNVDPVDQGNGHYLGKVNFTMTGWWRINLVVTEGSETISDELYFDVTF